jgi:hypothetical protein
VCDHDGGARVDRDQAVPPGAPSAASACARSSAAARAAGIAVAFGTELKTCPVQAWKQRPGLQEGKAFRSVTLHGEVGASLLGRAVADVIKRRARAAGLDCTEYSDRSLRAGLFTSVVMANVSERVIAKQSGHKSLLVLRTYIREGSLLQRTRRRGWGCRLGSRTGSDAVYSVLYRSPHVWKSSC